MAQSNYLVLIIALIFAMTFVVAVPPVTTLQQFQEGYTLQVHPIKQYFTYGQDVNFHVHVFNSSNGYPINTTITCRFHLYNTTGEHLVTLVNSVPDDFYDYEFLVKGGNFTEHTQSYHAFCYNGGIGGDYPYSIEVNKVGVSFSEPLMLTYIIYLLGFGGLFLLVLFFAIMIPYENKRNEENGEILSINWMKYVKIFLWVTVYIQLLFFFGTMRSIFEFYLLYDNASAFFSWGYAIMWALLYPMLILTGLFMIMKVFDDKKINDLIKRGVEMF